MRVSECENAAPDTTRSGADKPNARKRLEVSGYLFDADDASILDRPLRGTIFPDLAATEMRRVRMSLREWAEEIPKVTAARKDGLPLLSLARYGDERTDADCLRHGGNIRKIYGVEVDYDGEGDISVAQALAKLDDAEIAYGLYTSATHHPGRDRYRILFPLSDGRHPNERERLVARVNGIFGGALDPKSFTVSQSFYFGSARRVKDKVTGKWRDGVPIRVELEDGLPLDLADHLDARALDKHGQPYRRREKPAHDDCDEPDLTPDDIERIRSALDAIPVEVVERYPNWLEKIGMPLHHAFNGHPDGMELWNDVSQWCDSYDRDELESKWESMGRYNGPPSGLGTLFRLAKKHGWKDPRKAILGGLPIIDPASWHGVEMPPREWIWASRIPLGQATYFTGPGSAGKSLLSQQLATCVALGLPMLGIDTVEVTSLYLTCEDDADELHRRQSAICGVMDVSLRSLSGRLHLASLVGAIGNEMATFDSEGSMAVTEAYERVEAAAKATGARFIILDNVAHLFAGNENIRNQAAAFVGLMNRLATDIGGSVLFLGHPNKAGQEYSGSTAWENQVRSRLFLNWGEVDEDTRLPIDPDARVLTTGKANYGRKGNAIEFRWHNGAFMTDDELGDEEAREIAESTDERIFLRCLDLRVKQQRPVSESMASRTYAPKTFADMPEGKAIGRKRLEAAMERLFHGGLIERGVVGRRDGKDLFGLRRTEDDDDI